MRTHLILKQILWDEDLTTWIEIPPHSNIAACFDSFQHSDGEKSYRFSLAEISNQGDMYKYIKSFNLNLSITIPLSYMAIVYDCMIQLVLGMEYAHNNGLVHGSFSLSNVAVHKDGETAVYKITNFAPGSSMKLPLSEEASYWPFCR